MIIVNKRNSNDIENKKKKNYIKIILIVLIFIGVISATFVTSKIRKEEEKKLENFMQKFNGVWYDNKTGFELDIFDLGLGRCSFELRGMQDFIKMSPCKIELDKDNDNLKLTYTLEMNGSNQKETLRGYLKYNSDVSELTLKYDNGDGEYLFTKEDKVEEFLKDSHTYYLTNNKDYLKLYPGGICTVNLSSFTKSYSLTGAYRGAVLSVYYNNGDCTYTTTDYKDFIIKYTGTYGATMNPGGELYKNIPIVKTDGNEIHMSFDNKINYNQPKYTNGEWVVDGYYFYYKEK